jgi:uncharacterized protein (UPF0210 family)
VKVIRTICYFTRDPGVKIIERLADLSRRLEARDFTVQTQRVCTERLTIEEAERRISSIRIGVGPISLATAAEQADNLCRARNAYFHIDCTDDDIGLDHARLLQRIIKSCAGKTFNVAFSFRSPVSSPYFPCARYEREGFSIGLQPTNLATGVSTLDKWLNCMRETWLEIQATFESESDFLGIDSSVAPHIGEGCSLVEALQSAGISFEKAILSDTFLRITDFVQTKNPNPVGLCGLMLPCVEDKHLAELYERGEFSLERNLFLSLQCGVGIDTYPIGIDEPAESIAAVLRLVQGLSRKHDKPLSVRFVSDGRAGIGDHTDFDNPHMCDVVVRRL